MSTAAASPAISARDILTAVGEVIFAWTSRDDAIVWSGNARDVLGVPSLDGIATGAAFRALLDPATPAGREEAMAAAANTDDGRGVAYRTEYRLRLPGAAAPLWIEECGRWHADARGKPERARGVLRILDERAVRQRPLAPPGRDALTGQLDRDDLLASLGEALQVVGRSKKSAAFMLASLDDLPAINETFGRQAGDRALVETARRMRTCLRAGDVIGRYTGSNFGILVMNCSERAMAIAGERFAAGVRGAAADPSLLPAGLAVTIAGVSLPRHARDLDEAMIAAEQALVRAREERPGGFLAYQATTERPGRATRRAETARQIVSALAEGRLGLGYEPMRWWPDGRPAGWRAAPAAERSEGPAPRAGGDMLAVAAALGLGSALDLRVLDCAASDLAAVPTLELSVAFTGSILSDPRWLKALGLGFAGRPDEAARLTVEVPAAALAVNPTVSRRFVGEVRGLGIRLAATGFGDGALPADALRRLQPDRIDLGASVVALAADEADHAQLDAVVRLAGVAAGCILAPGVADRQVAARLATAGVALVTGPLAGPAIPDRPLGPEPRAIPA